ncbi:MULTISPECIES: pyruvate dehydrogenase (acetyl-transferring) E1 component subunit alpha [unclassified Fusibacter]|uniref:pyruvate dehydrogenase (acetyl-transferring) E1 component subunit alpha n=1 Tax=unclassified Fusibacter TaxID=2624464 RepID=UPI001012D155|nr:MULTISPECIES: pyruvate dehydrogenase (acetyl-transferring) E1 component subunit alpha [unclassified Fusibacter]MCK8061308.1 pyruvate dehydrogenase (acetyl-transferring) E1 component subunit alpha [Fusibacter sp. A2]NPE23495.1 pyruvate dehydrogenase (acetyl-transferring) E1 component subunit alpha [Fusibacter sp. A1]RXV59101.1 pyruvate dehydrogenase (acetyl-transferring) E1 component subunit alpha [Fusibacter sp. A1]
MYFKSFNPLDGEQLQIMNEHGEIIRDDLMPDISDEDLIEMYKTMLFSRVIDTKTLQYQRQGRMLTYAPNLGQEATQVGTIAATRSTDWMASAFRELGAWLYRGAPLYNILLYWYGNEWGMHMPEDVKILPVSVPIASQLQHAAGLAYASVLKGEDDIAIGYVGDGGTSQGDFHEALNFAAVMNTPNVFIVQNNQYAISTKRSQQTNAATIAQKAIAYGMPGIQVDGNDIFAVYAATEEAVKRARSGGGPSLIECYTYRLGAHTTADDPTKYRDNEEVEQWKKKDPIDRLKKHLIMKNLWTEEKDLEQIENYGQYVKSTFEKVENSGLVPLEDVFDYHYEKRTPELERQYQERKAYNSSIGS